MNQTSRIVLPGGEAEHPTGGGGGGEELVIWLSDSGVDPKRSTPTRYLRAMHGAQRESYPRPTILRIPMHLSFFKICLL